MFVCLSGCLPSRPSLCLFVGNQLQSSTDISDESIIAEVKYRLPNKTPDEDNDDDGDDDDDDDDVEIEEEISESRTCELIVP